MTDGAIGQDGSTGSARRRTTSERIDFQRLEVFRSQGAEADVKNVGVAFGNSASVRIGRFTGAAFLRGFFVVWSGGLFVAWRGSRR
jgi:hypothetical protein